MTYVTVKTDRRGLTMIELIVVIAILSILVTLLVPALGQAKASSKFTACKNNFRQIGIGLALYLDECAAYPHFYEIQTELGPRPIGWETLLYPFCGSNQKLLQCPSVPLPSRYPYPNSHTYDYNRNGTAFSWDTEHVNLGLDGDLIVPPTPFMSSAAQERANKPLPESRVRVPADMIAVGHFFPFTLEGFGWPGFFIPRDASYRKHPRDSALFCDGHVESSNPDLIPKKPNVAGLMMFVPNAGHSKRWNNDNEPHPENWSLPVPTY